MREETILEGPGAPPASEFQRTIVFRMDEANGAQLVLECGHAVFQVIAQPYMGIGQKLYCAGCVNYLVKNKRELPQAYRLEHREEACKCCGANIFVTGPGGTTRFHINKAQALVDPETMGEPVILLNTAYEFGFLAGAKEALQTHG